MYKITKEQLEDLYNNFYINKISKLETSKSTKIDRGTIRKYFKLFDEKQYENLIKELLTSNIISKNSYTDKDFEEAVKTSISIREAISKLGLIPAGANYHQFHKTIARLNISTSHFKGQAANKGKTLSPKRDIQDYLNNIQSIQSHKLKLRLIKEGIKQHQCESCLLTLWNNKPIPLELDHINGNNCDNSLTNLRLLCPNCHAQTDTYRGKNIKVNSKIESINNDIRNKRLQIKNEIKALKLKYTCLICKIEFESRPSLTNNYCSQECSHKSQQKNEYSKELIIQLLIKYKGNLVQSSKELNISDNGLRKWCKKYNLNPKDYK